MAPTVHLGSKVGSPLQFESEFLVRMDKAFTLVKTVRAFASKTRGHFKLKHAARCCQFFRLFNKPFADAVSAAVFIDVHFLDFANKPAVVQQVLHMATQKTNGKAVRPCYQIDVVRVSGVLNVNFPLRLPVKCLVFEQIDERVNVLKVIECGWPDLDCFHII
jgi:hypothetical protein